MNFGSCGRWRNGRLAPPDHCTMAGSEECDFECPYRDHVSMALDTAHQQNCEAIARGWKPINPDGVPPTAQYEARRWCKGDGEWTNWQPVPPDALARRLADSTFEVRATDGVGAAGGGQVK